MKILFIDVKYIGEIKLNQDAIKELGKYKKIALYTTTQFNHKIKGIIEQLNNVGIKVISSQPERTSSKFQILGCDVYQKNLKLKEQPGAFLYIGDGRFHPNALLFSENNLDNQNPKPVLIYNPIENKLTTLNKSDVEKTLKRKKANFARFHASESIGVLVTTKPGQSHPNYTKKLEKKYKNKKFHTFIADSISFNEMENFPFIQCWVNTACPRIALEDALNTDKALINAEDVL
jgi:2-(3-amino-3-carboxypropyl)histidine synthase